MATQVRFLVSHLRAVAAAVQEVPLLAAWTAKLAALAAAHMVLAQQELAAQAQPTRVTQAETVWSNLVRQPQAAAVAHLPSEQTQPQVRLVRAATVSRLQSQAPLSLVQVAAAAADTHLRVKPQAAAEQAAAVQVAAQQTPQEPLAQPTLVAAAVAVQEAVLVKVLRVVLVLSSSVTARTSAHDSMSQAEAKPPQVTGPSTPSTARVPSW
jgi:hypothetical protein